MAGALPNGIRTSDLKSRVLNLAQSSVYQIRLVPPPGVIGFLQSRGIDFYVDAPNIELLCREVTLPTSSLQTFEVYDNYAGVTENMVQRRDFGKSLRATFYVDRDYKVLDIFDGWQDYISNQLSVRDYSSPYASYRMQYPSQYRGTMFITKFEKDAYGVATQYTMVGAYPLDLNVDQLSYDRSNILKIQVSMTYLRYVRENIRWKPENDSIFDNGVIDFARLNRGIDSDGNSRPGTAN